MAALRHARAWWQRPSGRQGRLVILVGLNLLMLIVVFTALIVRHFGDTAAAAGAVRAEQVAKTASYQLQLALFMVDRGLQQVERRVADANGQVTRDTLISASQFPEQLQVNLGFINAEGDLVAAMRSVAVEPIRLLDREFIRPHFAGRVTGTYVGRPIVERLSKRWSLPISRAVRTADGRLLGIVVASLDAAALGERLHDVSLGPTDILDIASPAGEVWVRWPRNSDHVLAPIAHSISADRAYIGAAQDLAGWPLKVEVGLDPSRIAAAALPFQLFIVGGAAIGALLVAFFSALLFGKTREATAQRDEIAARQKHLLAMLDAIPADIFEFDADDRLVLSNSQGRSSFLGSIARTGETLRDIMTRGIALRTKNQPNPDSMHRLEDNLDFFKSGGSREERDARDAWRRTYITPLPGGGRVVMRVDISELKREKARVRAGEARYAELVGSLPDALLTIGESGRVLYASEASAEVLGRPPTDMVGRRLAKFIVERDFMLIMEGLQRLRDAPETPQTIVCESVRPDGSRRFVQIKFKLRAPSADTRPGDVVPIQLTAVVRDIHDQHMLAQKLDQEAANLHSVFEATGASILLLDADQRVKLANHAFLFLFGATQDEVVGKRFDELGFGAIPAAHFAEWRSAGRGRSLKPVEFDVDVMISESQRRVMRVTANPATDQRGVLSHIVLIGVDDTDRRMAEIRLFDSSRLTNLGEMASGIAHEINQPLAIIRLAAESVSEELEMPEAADMPLLLSAFLKQKLERIASQTERASGIIRDLRTVARKPGNESLPFDLGEAVRVGCDLLREQMRLDRVDFHADLAVPGPQVHGEAGRIQQVIINLVNNARDALTERLPRPDRGAIGRIDVRLETDEANGNAVLFVEDDGTGIPQKVLSRLFEPFFTTKPVGKGTGLGLSISYDIVNRMGGKMIAENRPEGGARFRVTFPIVKPAELRTAA